MTERLVQPAAVAIATIVLVTVVVISRAHRIEASTTRAAQIMEGVAAAMTSPASYRVTSAVLKIHSEIATIPVRTIVGPAGVTLESDRMLRLPDPNAGINESMIWETSNGQRVELRTQSPRVLVLGGATEIETHVFTTVVTDSRRWQYVMHVATGNDSQDYGFVRISDLPTLPPIAALTFPLARCYPSPRFAGTGTLAGRLAFILDMGRSMCPGTTDADLLGAGGRYDRYIWVDAQTYFVLKDELHEASGNVVAGTTREVTSIEYNVAIPADRFTFQIPQYATVMDCTGVAPARPQGC